MYVKSFCKIAMTTLVSVATIFGSASATDKIKLRLATSGSETDQRSIAMAEVFGPKVSEFAEYLPGYNGTLFAQGTELEAISRGNLEMAITSAQELSQFFPEFSIFAAGYVHQDAEHQIAVFKDELMEPFKKKVEDKLGIKLLSVMYLGRRQVNLRQEKTDLTVMKPEDLAGVNLRMPSSDAWQFLGRALGAAPTPMALSEVYTALQTGAVDGQDNPLPLVVDAKFYEVTKQVVLTSHLVDLNYIAISNKLWKKLTPEQQKITQEAADEAAAYGRAKQLELEDNLVAFLKEKGMEIYEPDLSAFRTHVQAEYQKSKLSKSWPKDVLDKINALGN